MGFFRRNKDADGLYLGDAPVSSPGVDGAAPGAYLSQTDGSTISAADVDPGADFPATGDFPATADLSAGYQTGYQQPTQLPDQLPDQLPGQLSDQPGQPGVRVLPGHGLDPATAARVQAALAKGASSGSKVGCVVIAIPVIGGLVAAGIGIVVAVKAATSANDVMGGVAAAPGIAAGGSGAGAVELGKPVSITTADASYRITVYGAETQRGGGWGYDGPDARPALIVGAEIARTDAGQEPIEFTGWNWSVIGDDGQAVLGDIISHFAPSLDGPELKGGESTRGFVSFDTSVTDVELAVAGSPFGAPLARWHLSATVPHVVAGEIGTPAQGEISRPGFTVTVGQPEIVPADDERVGYPPESGQYLAVPVTFTGVPHMEGSIGNVDNEQFVFVPDGSSASDPPLTSAFGGLDGSGSFFSIAAEAPTKGVLAFDTVATQGELQLRGEADQPIVTWRISVS